MIIDCQIDMIPVIVVNCTMGFINLLALTLLTLTGSFDADIFIHKSGINSYNINFACKNIRENDILKIKINTSKIINHHKYIFPAKHIRVFSPYTDNICDSMIRTIDNTLIFISKKPDIYDFTLSFDLYNSAVFVRDSAFVFPFIFRVYPPLYAKTDIYIPNTLDFNIIKRADFTIEDKLIEYKGADFNRLSNLHLAFNKSDMRKQNYSILSFYFSLLWSYLIPLLLIVLIFLYINMGKYRKVPYIPDVVVYSPPKDLSPEEINFLLHNTLNLNGMISIIFNLARKGYIEITREKNASPLAKPDYKITKIRKHYGDNITKYELKILKTLFPFPNDKYTYISDKSTALKRKYIEIVGDLSEHMAKEGYYDKDPMAKRFGVIVFGILIMILGTSFLFIGNIHKHSIPFYQHHIEFSIILTGIIIAISNRFFSFRTVMGDYTLAEIKGFYEYFFRTDREKIKYSTENLLTDFYTTFATAMDYNSTFLSEFKYYLSDRYKEKDGIGITEEILNDDRKIVF